MIDFSLPGEIAELEAELARFAERELRPRMREFEAARSWDSPAVKALDAFGVPGLDLPEPWGGAGAGALAKVVALEALARGDAGGLLAADSPGAAGAAAVGCPDEALAREVGSASLGREARSVLVLGGRRRAHWLPGSEAPRWTWVTEGERLRLLGTERCEARPAEAAAFHASGGVGVDLAGAETIGEWALDAERALRLRGRARLWPAAVAIGIAGASLDYAIAYAKERVVMGRPVAHHQGNAFAVAEAVGALDAARAAVRASAHRIDADAPWAGLWATLAYLDAVDAALGTTDLGVQLLGGHGYVEDHPAEKWFREARALAQLFGGRDLALEDSGDAVLDAPDPLLA